MLRRDLSFLDEKHICPHCEQEMSCCEAPPVHVGDGLGWGSEAMFICLNDSCSVFLRGWESIERQYGHHASYRYMELPRSKEGNYMMVGNKDAFKASVIDREELQRQNHRFQKEKDALSRLDSCVAEKNLEPVLCLILDEAASIAGRRKAISLLAELNDLSCIDPIRNHSFRDNALQMECNRILDELLKRNYKKECPACGELVKQQAKKCMYCSETF